MTDQPLAASVSSRDLISFRVAQQEFCIEVMSVREVRGWTPATPLPNAPSYVCGVVNLRGAVLPVVDLGARLGLPAAEATGRHVIIVAWIGEQLVGLLVDAVCDIVAATDDMIQPTPDVASELVKGLVKGIMALDGRMISLIQLENLFPPAAVAA
jgi:purine-binding chemotaxis protein CheW